MASGARSELERLLDPISTATFFAEYWERRPIHIPGRPEKFEHLQFDRKAFWRMIETLPESVKGLRTIYHDAKGEHQEILELEPRLAASLWNAGMTLVLTPVEEHHAGVAAFTRSLRASMDLPGPITVGVFFSPMSHGAGLHYDSHSAFVLQLEGRKRWRISREPALEFPPVNYGYKSDAALVERRTKSPSLATRAPVLDDLLEVELNPGDVLYMPPGTWHMPRAVDTGGSLALTLAPFPKNALQLVTEQMSRDLAERLSWRRSVPAMATSAEPRVGLPSNVDAFFRERIDELRAYVNALEPAALARLWHSEVAPPPAPAKRPAAEPLTPGTRIVADRERRVSYTPGKDAAGEDALYFYLDGEEIDLPATAARFAEALATRDSFVAAEAQGWVAAGDEPYDWDDVKAILEVFISRGYLACGVSPRSPS